jgi:hypothetical protein
MSKKRNNNSTHTSTNDDEVNIKKYPYYRKIPIQTLGDKQRRIIEKFKVEEIPNEEQRQEQRQEQEQEQEQTIIPAAPATTVYENTDFVDLPTFNLVKMDGANCYKVDMTPHFIVEDLKKTKEQLEEEIKYNTNIIESQLDAIKTNDITIEQQVAKINYDNVTIQSNTNLIQQQVLNYNHNNVVLHNQSAVNNTEIMNQQQILQTQYHKITEYQAHIEQLQSHIEQLQSQLESYNQQMSYHNSMINAFNTVTQNPEYFIQLMAASMCNPIEIDDIHYNNTI